MLISLKGVYLSGGIQAIVVPPPPPTPAMLLTIDTLLGSTTVELYFSGAVNVTVDWGDATSDNYNSDGNQSHTYMLDGVYQISITGSAQHFEASFASNNLSLTSIDAWGSLGLVSLQYGCYGCSNLTSVPATLPATVTDISWMFYSASAFNGNISGWNTAAVTDMNTMFSFAAAFNQNIGSWNTAAVTDMNSMFTDAIAFNQNIGGWDTAAVTNMSNMFYNATAFNNGGSITIDDWDTGAVTNMNGMFSLAAAFNQPINSWDTSAVTDMGNMFNDAIAFDQDLSDWCVSLIGSLPSGFYTNTPAWNKTSRVPVWGTCP